MVAYLMAMKTNRCLVKDVNVIFRMVIGRLVIHTNPQMKMVKFVSKHRVWNLKDKILINCSLFQLEMAMLIK